MNDDKSDIAAVLDRASSLRASFGWVMGSWILLRAIGAADKKRSFVKAGMLTAFATAVVQFWLKSRA